MLGFTPIDSWAVLPSGFNLTKPCAAPRFGVGPTDSCAVSLFGITIIDSCAEPPFKFVPIDSCAVPFTYAGSSTTAVFCTDHPNRLTAVTRGRFGTSPCNKPTDINNL